MRGGGGGLSVSLCLSPGSTLLCQVQDLLLACLQQFLEHAAPAAAVCYSVLPHLCIDIQSFHIALADIFISQLGATLESFARSKLTIEDVLGFPTVFHMAHMTKPAQSASSKQHLHCEEASTGKNLSVGHFAPPADAKDAVKTLDVETVHLLLML